MTEEDFNDRMKVIKENNKQKQYRKLLSNEKKVIRTKPKIETSKLIAVYLFLLLNCIVIYAMVAMWYFVDLSYLGVLISDIAAQVLIYAIYCLKAYKAKKSEEELAFRREKSYGTLSNMLSAGANSQEQVRVNGDIDTFSPPVG